MATADCGCILTYDIILYTLSAVCSAQPTKEVHNVDEHVTLTNGTSAGTTQHHVLCGADTCPVTLEPPSAGTVRGTRLRENALLNVL